MRVLRKRGRSYNYRLVLPVLMILAAAFMATSISNFGGNQVTGRVAMQPVSETSESGGSVTIGGIVLGTKEEEDGIFIALDLNGDKKTDKTIDICKDINAGFYSERYPIGSYVKFTNLEDWGNDDIYSITDKSDKEHGVGFVVTTDLNNYNNLEGSQRQ